MNRIPLLAALAVIALAALSMDMPISVAKESPWKYPAARRVDQTDEYHGQQVADPYRWLETDVRESEEVAAWIAAENQVTRAYLDAIPARAEFRTKLEKLWNFARYTSPIEAGGRYFWQKNDGLQNQPVLYWSERADDEGRPLVDPNPWSADGTIALGQWAPSEDGRLLTYARQEAGSDWVTIHVVEVATGKKLDDVLLWSRHGGMVWNKANDGFWYTRYPEPPEGQQYQAPSINQMIYFHRLGEPQSRDALVHRDAENPTRSFHLARTDDDRYLVLAVYRGTDPQNMVLVRRVDAATNDWTTLVGSFDNEYSIVGNDGSRLFFVTDLDAPTKRIVTIDAEQPERDRNAEIVPAHGEAALDAASIFGDKLVCQYVHDVASEVKLYGVDGTPRGEVELPGVGTATGFLGRQTDKETFFAFAGYTTPTSIYRYELANGKTTRIRKADVDFDSDKYESRLDFCTSKDGARVPVIVTYRKGLKRTGDHPTLLYAYGGFSISITPYFSVEYAAWLDKGGVVAVANLRGGGEYGEAWHVAGKKLQKQNVFDDFLAAAEWLVDEKYTNHQQLGVMGGSNGGLLVGAVETQRPELFGACVPVVGVMDMLRFHQFTAGHFWRDEYGSADDPEEFRALRAYSPYHNIEQGAHYPPTLIVTADTDDRVVPMHSFKYAAALQHAQGGDAPILIRVETRAGHGSGLPISKRIDQSADVWAFLWKNLAR